MDTKAKTIVVANYDGLSRKISVSFSHSYCIGISVADVKEPSDIAVDWVSNHIYWVDTKAKTIEVADYDGLSRKILVSTNLRGPRNIAADPISGYVFPSVYSYMYLLMAA